MAPACHASLNVITQTKRTATAPKHAYPNSNTSIETQENVYACLNITGCRIIHVPYVCKPVISVELNLISVMLVLMGISLRVATVLIMYIRAILLMAILVLLRR